MSFDMNFELEVEGVGCVSTQTFVFWVCICAYFLGVHSVRVSIQTFDFLGVHLHIFSCCAFCMDGIYPNVVYYS